LAIAQAALIVFSRRARLRGRLGALIRHARILDESANIDGIIHNANLHD
jgi:hypothetical protein